MIMFILAVLSLFSGASYAMEYKEPEMMKLIAYDGEVIIPVDVAQKAEILRGYYDNAEAIGKNRYIYNFGETTTTVNDSEESFIPAEKKVLEDLFRCISDPSSFSVTKETVDHHQKVFVMSDYVGAPRYIRGLLMCRLLDAIGHGNHVAELKSETSNLIYDGLSKAIETGHLDLRGASFSTIEGLLSFFDKKIYADPNDVLDGSKIKSIDLGSNRLQELDVPRLLIYFPQLCQLDLSHNLLKRIDAKNLPYGFRLDVSHNRLRVNPFQRRQNQFFVNVMHNRLSVMSQQAVFETIHGGDRVYWARRGIAATLSFFNPGAAHSRLAGVLFSMYFMNKVNNQLDNLKIGAFKKGIGYISAFKNWGMEKIPEKTTIAGREVPVRTVANNGLNFATTASVVAGARCLGGSWLGIGLIYALVGKTGVFNYHIVRTLFDRYIKNPLVNRVIFPGLAKIGRGMIGVYNSTAHPFIARMNEYVNCDANRLFVGEQHPEESDDSDESIPSITIEELEDSNQGHENTGKQRSVIIEKADESQTSSDESKQDVDVDHKKYEDID